MKKITNLLIVASLAFAGALMAQEPSPEQSPTKKGPEKKAPAEVKPKAPQAPKTEVPAVAPKTEAPAMKEPALKEKGPAMTESPAVTKPEKAEKPEKKAPANKKNTPAAAPEKKESAEQPATSTTPTVKTPPHSKDMKSPAANAKTSPSASPATAKTTPAPTTAPTTPATAATSTTPAAANTPATAASASVAPATSQTSPTKPVNPTAPKKPDQVKVQQIQQQHVSFHAQPRPDRAPAVTFNASFRLPGVEAWVGPQYEVYRSYHPERHDRGWYSSRYQRVELIAGGYYYFNNGYWYPAWGYNPTNEYYAYDAPIYVGKHAEPPDKVIADVQAVLQEMGYYKGEVDGLIGPLTREALTAYQNDQGLVATAVIDEPTLASLDMG